jgi:hypothetical protein
LFIIYTPEGGEPEEFDASTLRVSEVAIVQRTIDMKWAEIRAGLGEEDLDAMRGVIWVLKKRGNPSLRFAEFDPGINEMVTRMDKSEVRAWVEHSVSVAAKNPDVTREQIAEALSELPDAAHDPEHARQLIAEMTADPKDSATGTEVEETRESDESPSQTSNSPEPSTWDSSPTSSTSHLLSSTT